jgi:hypothetical protein
LTTPRALLSAARFIWRETHRTVPIHSIRLRLTTEPDQYEIRFVLPRQAEQGVIRALVPRLTLTRFEFEAADAWLDNRYPGGRPW